MLGRGWTRCRARPAGRGGVGARQRIHVVWVRERDKVWLHHRATCKSGKGLRDQGLLCLLQCFDQAEPCYTRKPQFQLLTQEQVTQCSVPVVGQTGYGAHANEHMRGRGLSRHIIFKLAEMLPLAWGQVCVAGLHNAAWLPLLVAAVVCSVLVGCTAEEPCADGMV